MSTYVTGESLCLECEGLEIYAHRSKVDGRLVVCIDTADLQDTDNHSTGVPDIRVMVNDSVSGIDADGGWVEVKP